MTAPDLHTTWLGLRLRSPLVVGAAGPLSEDPDQLQRFEDCGAGAIVLQSLFEEQLEREQQELHLLTSQGADCTSEALSYFPEAAIVPVGEATYLQRLEQASSRLEIPVIASLNGSHPGRWVQTARRLAAAGAAAIELNILRFSLDPELSSAAIEAEVAEIVAAVRAEVAIPLTIKLGPFYTNLAAMAARLAAAGAEGLTLFNRFYQPDIDIETLELRPNLLLSTPHDLRLPLRWIALLHGRQRLDFAASGGVHRGTDVVKLLMAGASVTQVVGALLRHGPERLRSLNDELRQWLHEHERRGVAELIGTMSQSRCPDPEDYERFQYMRALQTYPRGAAREAPGPW